MFCPHCGKQTNETDQYCRNCAGPLRVSAMPSVGAPSSMARSGAVAEVFFLQNSKGVTVSNLRFVTTGVTYAMANVSSVRLEARSPKRSGPLLILIASFLWWVLMGHPHPGAGHMGAYYPVCGVIASLTWLGAQKTHFFVRVQGGGGESDALSSTDRAYVQQVVAALEQAIIARG